MIRPSETGLQKHPEDAGRSSGCSLYASLFQRLLHQFFDQALFWNEWQSYVIGVFVVLVVFDACCYGMLVPRPRSSRHTAHDVPRHSRLDDAVYTVAAVEDQSKATIDRLSYAHAAPIVE